MTSFIHLLLLLLSITLPSQAQYLLPITQHKPTKQFYTTLPIGSSSTVNLLLDLRTNLTWLTCRKLKPSHSLRLVHCQTSTCKTLPGTGCDGRNNCLYTQPTPLAVITPAVTTGRVVQDKTTVSKSGPDLGTARPPKSDILPRSKSSLSRFTFSCAEEKHLRGGLAPPVAGVLALSPGQFPLWRQVASAFGVIPRFALCLPSSGTGRFYIGGANYYRIPPFNGGNNPVPLTLTPFKNMGSGDYVLSVMSMYVGGRALKLNSNLLEGGAKLSTVVPYTVLQSDIYNALARSFTQKATKIGMFEAPGHEPFTDCFDEGASTSNKRGLKNVPLIEIGVPGRAGEVKWTFHGENTVVRVLETVICLAFVDGGKKPKEPMVIGTYQLQNYLIDFDFSTKLMAFSDSLLLHNTSCSTWPSRK